ncbi:hypothetical protein AC1031_004090 [Aphanomyces cochlioides]|nr:hypothetical protein AC1031_004090 [Aphanomyces cochlioides]
MTENTARPRSPSKSMLPALAKRSNTSSRMDISPPRRPPPGRRLMKHATSSKSQITKLPMDPSDASQKSLRTAKSRNGNVSTTNLAIDLSQKNQLSLQESTKRLDSRWQIGDYVSAKCHDSQEYFAGHIQGISDSGDVYNVLFDDLTLDKCVPLANIQGLVDSEAMKQELNYCLTDHLDDQSDISIVDAVSKRSEGGTNKQLEASNVRRVDCMIYDDLLDTRITTANLAFATPANPAHDTRSATQKQLQRIQAALQKMNKPPILHKGSSSKFRYDPSTPTNQAFTAQQDVVVCTPSACFFGVVQSVEESTCTVQGHDGKVHSNVAISDVQPCWPHQELLDQCRELAKSIDVLYPGAKVLHCVQDKLVPCTIRRRRNATCFDLKIDGSVEAKTKILVDAVVALPQRVQDRVRITNQFDIEAAGKWFHVHERVIVHDLDVGVSNHGIITAINNNKTVVVDYDNGEVDSAVPPAYLRKADSSIKDAGAFMAAFNLDHAFDMGETTYNVDDWVIASHPLSNLYEKGRICRVYSNGLADVQFADSTISKQVAVHKLRRVEPTRVAKPPSFNVNDYVLAYAPRFSKYCTGRVQAVVAGAYRVVFDYGEIVNMIPHDYITTLEDTAVLSPKKRITRVWKSSNGYEDDQKIPCNGDVSTHKAVCGSPLASQKKPVAVGELVMAQYSGSAKYFGAIVVQVRSQDSVDVAFISSEAGAAIPLDKVLRANRGARPDNRLD